MAATGYRLPPGMTLERPGEKPPAYLFPDNFENIFSKQFSYWDRADR
jgi:hypothetical protein